MKLTNLLGTIISLITLPFLLSGCAVIQLEQPTLEEYGAVQVMGFDVSEEKEKIRVTFVLPQADPIAEEKSQIYSMDAMLPYEGIIRFTAMSDKELTTSQLRVILISEELARTVGVGDLLHTLYRDPQIGVNVRIAIAKGKVEEMLNQKFKDKPPIGYYLTQLLTPRESRGFNPFSTLHDFVFRKTDLVSDPSAPYLESNDKAIEISRVALFKGSKMVATLAPEEAKIVEALKKNKVLPDMVIPITDEKPMIMRFVETEYDIKTNGDSNDPKIHLHLYVRGSIVDYEGKEDLSIDANRQKFEEQLAKELEKLIISMTDLFQEKEIDPIAIGRHFRFDYKGKWTEELWYDILKRADITAHAKVTIISTGTLR